MKDVRTILKTTREDLGWSQDEAAHRAGMSKSTVRRVERGEEIHENRLRSLARALGIELKVMGDVKVSPLPAADPGPKPGENGITIIGNTEACGVWVSLLPGVFTRLLTYSAKEKIPPAAAAAHLIAESLRDFGTFEVTTKPGEASDVGGGTVKKSKRAPRRTRTRAR